MTSTYAQHPRKARSLAEIPVREAMHRGLLTCEAGASLRTVARVLAAHRVHAVVVSLGEEAGEWGLVSDLDLAAAASEAGAAHTTAGELASSPRLVVRPDETMARAAQLMRDYETHHLIVVGRGSERPLGIVSTLDVADVVAELP